MQMTIVQAINSALRDEMERNQQVVILGEDVGKNGGVFRATEGLHSEFGPSRVMDTPLNESGMKDHPLTPMRDADLRRVLQRQTRLPVGHVAYAAVEAGAAAITLAVDRNREAIRHVTGKFNGNAGAYRPDGGGNHR